MWTNRLALTTVLLSSGFGVTACQSDDAVERDTRDARQEVQKEAGEAGDDIEQAVPGNADDDGK
jgi:hypothetical protein